MTRLKAIIAKAGVTPQAAHVWQKASKVEDAVIEDYIAAANAAGREITVAGLLQWARDDKKGENVGGDGNDGSGGGGNDEDKNLPTHVCPKCGVLIVCDRGGE